MKLRPPVPLNLIGIEAFKIFLSKLRPINGSREIWFKLGHNRFFVGEYDESGQFAIAATKLIDRNDPTSRVRTTIYPDAHLHIASWCEVNNGGAFFLPSQPQGLPLKNNVLVSDDIALELDSGTAIEQWNLIWEFVEISGLKPSYLLHSAGKSYHGHWKATDHLRIAETIRLRKLLAIALHSDPAVINPHQPMRLPGFYRKEKGAYQSLSYHSEERYTLEVLESGLARFYQHRGLPFPEVLSDKQWAECRRVITWDNEISDRVYNSLVGFGYQLPEVIEEKQLTINTKTLVLEEAIGANVKNCEIKRILEESSEYQVASSKYQYRSNSKCIERKDNSKTNNSLLATHYSLLINNPWVEFYQQTIIPSIVSLELAFDLYPHNFIPNGINRLDGDPGYRSSHGGRSFTVSWRNGQPVYRDWLEAESGDLIKYYWRSKGYSGYPRGKDYIDMVCAIADRHNIPIPKELTRAYDEPDDREYQEYLEWEKEQELVEQQIDTQKFVFWLNNEFITWFKAQKNNLSKKFKGFVTKEVENTPIDRLPESIEYYSGNTLPTPELYQGRKPPRIIFRKGDRLSVIAELKKRGWKRVWDSSQMGLGKSYDAGKLSVDPDTKHKIWYLDQDHRNVSTPTVKGRYVDLEPKHDGQIPKDGKLVIAKTPEEKANATVKSNCHLADHFIAFKERNWEFEQDEGDRKAPNPICGNCIYHKKKALNSSGEMVALCAASRGEGYGYRYERKETLAQRQIRASVYSLPSPSLVGQETKKQYDYTNDTAILEEASHVKGIKEIKVKRNDFDRAFMDLANKAPDLFAIVHPLLRQISNWFEGLFPFTADRFGLGHNAIVDLLGDPPEDLTTTIAELSNYQIRASELIVQPINDIDIKRVPKRWKGSAIAANKYLRSEAWIETLQNLSNLHANFLIPFLEIWNANEGALRFNKATRELVITIRDRRTTNILRSMGFLVLMDSTLDLEKMAKVIDCDRSQIIEIQQEGRSLSNIKVIQVEAAGMKSSQWSPSCLDRLETLAEYLKSKHPDIGIIGLKKYAEDLDLKSWWWRDNRGTNKFLGREAIATFGTPQTNLGAAEDEYLTLFGTMEGFKPYYRKLALAEFTQLVGRFRAHLYPDRQFTLYCVSTNLDLSHLEQLGCEVIKRDVVDICPEAATRRQQDKRKMFNVCLQLQKTRQKITQAAIAAKMKVTQSWICKLFQDEGLTWSEFMKLFHSLYRSTKADGISSVDDVTNERLREFLELDPVVVAKHCIKYIREHGIEAMIDLLLEKVTTDVRMSILGALAASLGLGENFNYEPYPDG